VLCLLIDVSFVLRTRGRCPPCRGCRGARLLKPAGFARIYKQRSELARDFFVT